MDYKEQLNQYKDNYSERLQMLYKKKEVVYSKNLEEEIMITKGRIQGIDTALNLLEMYQYNEL